MKLLSLWAAAFFLVDNMRILYYDWDEFNGEDCRDAMRRLGHRIEVLRARFNDGSMDKEGYIHLQVCQQRT